jgi:glutathione S-transferase
MENLQSEINRESQLLDDYLTGTEFLVGNEFSIADIAMSSFISRLTEFSDFDISEEHKNLWTWFDRVNTVVKHTEAELAEA